MRIGVDCVVLCNHIFMKSYLVLLEIITKKLVLFPKITIFAELFVKCKIMNFLTFRERMCPMRCININQVLSWVKDFDRNNLARWFQRGLLIKLGNQYYVFFDYCQVADISRFIANRMYVHPISICIVPCFLWNDTRRSRSSNG